MHDSPISQQLEINRKAMREQQQANFEHPSILTQYKALQGLSEDPAIYRATIFIPLLLIFLEMIPVLAKTLAGVSTYELLAYQQRQDAIDHTDRAKLESETTLARKRLFELSNVDLAKHEKNTVAELHRGVHDQVRDAFLQKIRERIQHWCPSLTDHADVQHLEDRLSKLFRERIQCIAESVSTGLHMDIKGSPAAVYPHRQPAHAEPSDPPIGTRGVNTSRHPEIDSTPTQVHFDHLSAPAPPTPPSNSSTPQKKNSTNEGFQEYRTSFLKKSAESIAAKIPDFLVFLFHNAVAFIAGPPAVTIGLASSTGISWIVLFPVVFFAFAVGRMAAKNFRHTSPQFTTQ
jgi:hypothetical protein